jgi:TPR repeat protein
MNRKLKSRLIIYPIIFVAAIAYAAFHSTSPTSNTASSTSNDTALAPITMSKHPNAKAEPNFLLVSMAKMGSTKSQLSLAKFYLDNNEFAKAQPWADKVYASNDTVALNNLGLFYLLKNHNKEALKFLEKGAYKLNDASSMAQLGRIYWLGIHGVKKDNVKAEKLLKASANMNNALGQFVLGLFYVDEGKYGLGKDSINLALPRLPAELKKDAIQTLNDIKQAQSDEGAEKLIHTLSKKK